MLTPAEIRRDKERRRAGDPLTARMNNAHAAMYTDDALAHPFAEGGFRWVAKGTYAGGDRKGEPCVCKWFKDGVVDESKYYAEDLKVVETSRDIVEEFNHLGFIDQTLRINIPEVWTFGNGHFTGNSNRWNNTKVLQEPWLLKFQKFNSNTGWVEKTSGWPEVMQALSHFSFHYSGGQHLLCDLQGGMYRGEMILTDPAISSRDCSYGTTDLGWEGIEDFFYWHRCNRYCEDHWQMPNRGVPLATPPKQTVAGTAFRAPKAQSVQQVMAEPWQGSGCLGAEVGGPCFNPNDPFGFNN